MSRVLNWIDTLFFGVRRIFAAGVELPERPALNFVGAVVTDNPAENRTDVFIPGRWLVSPIVTTTYTARPGEFVRVNAHDPVTIRLPPAARNVGAEVVIKEVAGNVGAGVVIKEVAGEKPIEVLTSTGQRVAQVGPPPRHDPSGQRRRDVAGYIGKRGSNYAHHAENYANA